MKLESMDLQLGRSALCDQIADRIEQMILSDTTQVQQKLPSEQTLASGFGVSRPVIREALMILKERGLVTPRQGGGSYITIPKTTQVMETVGRLALMRNIGMEDVLAVRIQLEAMAARLAAENAAPAQIKTLRDINREMAEQKGDLTQRVQLDLKFHKRIATLSGNKMLEVFVESMNGLLAPMLKSSLCLPMANEDGIRFHDRIVEALLSGDADKSERIIREHLMLFARNWELATQHAMEEQEE